MDGGRRAPMDGLSASRTSLPHAGLSTSVAGEWITAEKGMYRMRVLSGKIGDRRMDQGLFFHALYAKALLERSFGLHFIYEITNSRC